MADRQDSSEALAETGGRGAAIVTHAVLTGLTPLIPVPLVDDILKSYFRKRLVRSLAAGAGRPLSEEEVDALAAEKGGGCLGGCVMSALVYPLKAVFRKLFYVLEMKRAADVTSRTYHFGYLVQHALRPRAGGPSLVDLRGARAVGEAVDAVCRKPPRPAEVAAAAESVEPEEERQLKPVVTRLQRSIASVPEEHFRRLRDALDARLGLPPDGA